MRSLSGHFIIPVKATVNSDAYDETLECIRRQSLSGALVTATHQLLAESLFECRDRFLVIR